MLDHKGCNSNGTNEERCLLMRFSCGAASLRAVLPAPAPFSSPFNHCLFTLSQELNEPWLRALPGKLCRPRPALPSVSPPPPHYPPSLPPLSTLPPPPPTTPPQHIRLHTNTHTESWSRRRLLLLCLPHPHTHTELN